MCTHNRKQQVKLLWDLSFTFKKAHNGCKEKGSQPPTAWGQFQFMPLLQAYRTMKSKRRQCTEALLWWEVPLIKLKPCYQPLSLSHAKAQCWWNAPVAPSALLSMSALMALKFKQLKCHMRRQMQPRAVTTDTDLSAIKSSEHLLRNKNQNNSTVKMPQGSAGNANSCPISFKLSPNCIL